MYSILILNLIFAIFLLIFNLLTAGSGYVDTTPNNEIEGLYNLFIKGNVFLPVITIYVGLSVVLLISQKRRKTS